MVTKAEITAGDRLRNNDPRIPDGDERKIVTVQFADALGVVYQSRTRRAQIGWHRIFLDGKTRAAGYNLLPRQSDMSDMA